MRTCVKSSPWQCAIPDPAGVFPGDPASGHTCKCITMQTRQSLSVVSYSKVIEDIPGRGVHPYRQRDSCPVPQLLRQVCRDFSPGSVRSALSRCSYLFMYIINYIYWIRQIIEIHIFYLSILRRWCFPEDEPLTSSEESRPFP